MIMATNEAITGEPETIRLTEDDISGAKLTGPMDSHTMALLYQNLSLIVEVMMTYND